VRALAEFIDYAQQQAEPDICTSLMRHNVSRSPISRKSSADAKVAAT
jgi:hypothetical protein